MRKAVVPTPSTTSVDADDWDTDPDFVNDVTEEQQRWGTASRSVGAIDMAALREATQQEDQQVKKKLFEEGPNAAYGYGGKFGVQADRMDKSAVGHDHIEKAVKHASQKDYATGFGGKYGVQSDRVDKSAVGWDHKENLQKHASQKDYSTGFGGKFGLQTDRVDKSAVGWDHKEDASKHSSQKDYATGFGGKYGVQADRIDKAAVGWDHKETVAKHASQTDHSVGFGGKFGVQSDRMDSSAKGWEDGNESNNVNRRKASSSRPAEVEGAEQKASQLKQRFEQMAKSNAEDAQNKPPPKKLPTLPAQKKMSAPPAVESPAQIQTSPLAEALHTVEPIEPVKEDVAESTNLPSQNMPVLAAQVSEEITLQNLEALSEDAWQETQEWDTDKQTVDAFENAGEEAGLVAIALYDYQAAADDELSFDPEDVITNIEMIDEGWWRGELNGKCGLFPANYVALQNQ